jgi:hypothetical protein
VALALWAVVLLTGCASPPVTIPTGEWIGEGTYVDYEAVLAADAPAARQRSKDHRYETTLKIAKARAFGREVMVVDVHSKRGPLFNVPGEETKAKAVLVPLETLDNGAVLYATLDAKTAEAPENREAALPPKTIAQATSTQTPNGLVLQLHYMGTGGGEMRCFIDTFHFQADGVLKTGTLDTLSGPADERKVAKVWWVERLRPVR